MEHPEGSEAADPVGASVVPFKGWFHVVVVVVVVLALILIVYALVELTSDPSTGTPMTMRSLR